MTIFYDDEFVEIDLLLRRGGHINRSDMALYDYMCKHMPELKEFYARYGCSLYQHPDGFFYAAIKGGKLQTRLLPKSCVHLGMFIALKARDPEITRSSGRISINQLLLDIETSIPRDILQQVYAPKRREAVVDECINDELKKALRVLAELSFIELTDLSIRPLEAISRFAELARSNNDPSDENRLNLIVTRGVVFGEGDDESKGDSDE